jgi:hypothetical protein
MAIKITGITKEDSIKKWDQLLFDKRERKSNAKKSIFDKRNPFENDYSRLISSAPISKILTLYPNPPIALTLCYAV